MHRDLGCRPPRYLATAYQVAGDARDRTAIDLGFGDGTVSCDLHSRGWRLFAIEKNREQVRSLIGRIGEASQHRLAPQIACGDFVDMQLPCAGLVHAAYALQFVPRTKFGEFWSGVRRALSWSGVFAGHFFGKRDAFASVPEFSVFEEKEVRGLFVDWDTVLFEEYFGPGQRDPSRIWNFWSVVAKKR